MSEDNEMQEEFNTVVQSIDTQSYNYCIDILRKIVTTLHIRYDDQRVVFSCKRQGLNFIVGQRYCISLDGMGFRIISKNKLNNDSGRFGGDEAYLTSFDQASEVSKYEKELFEKTKDELEKTNLSGFKKFDNVAFRNIVFTNDTKTNNMKFWVISPNVTNNASEEPVWKKIITEKHLAFMGWDEDHTLGAKFINTIQEGDIILVAQGANRQKRLFIAGIVDSKALNDEIENAPDQRWYRRLNPVLIQDELEKLNLDFNGTAYGDADRIPALYVLHPTKNTADKKLFEKIHASILAKQNKIPLEAKVIYAYLYKAMSHRRIQEEILGEEAPTRGGGYSAMNILHSFLINDEKKGLLLRTTINAEIKTAQGKYLDALNLLVKYYPELLINTKSKEMNLAKNIILYGPPGTGKTYHSIDYAVNIATGNSNSHSDNKAVFDILRKEGQIEFATFHQNYSYEDFMVGIRPNIESSQLHFKSHEGVFYKIAKKAKENYYDSLKDAETLSYESWVKNMFEDFKDYVETIIEKEGKFVIKNAVSIYGVEEEAFVYTGEKADGEKWKNERLGMHYDPLILMILKDVKDRKAIKAIEGIPSLEKQHSTYCFAIIQKYREFLKNTKREHKEEKGKSINRKNFVLIVDEINRANISKVFGELITLLEEDKRLGGENELKITLPNGESDFGVPPNLYVVGTMNTADKSIALIDIALRRRFEFKGHYPTKEVIGQLQNEGLLTPEKGELLNHINKQVFEKRNKSADFLIGHAYFINNKPIDETLENKIVPLL